MASEWNTTRLGEATVWSSGGTPSKKQSSYWDGDIPWISASTMKDTRLTNSDLRITQDGLTNGSKLAESGSVLLLVRGSELHKRIPIGIVTRSVAFNQDVKALKAKEGLLPEYLLYWLLGNENLLLSKVEPTGIGAGKLDTNVIKRLPVSLPPFDEQRAIARILGALDDKIELNRRMNETLEEMAQALFKSWFVDFDPVRAKAEGRRPEGSSDGVAAALPNSFEDTTSGSLPEGWFRGKIKDEFKLTMGQSPPGETYNETGQGLPFYQGTKDFGFRYPSRRVYCNAPKRIAEAGDTLVSVRAPVGDVNMASEPLCLGRGVSAIRHISGNRSYTYYAMQELRRELRQFEAEGTVFGSLGKRDFENLPILVPSRELVESFEEFAYPLDQQIENLTEEMQSLAELRDALLPKLLSGEVRVPKAEREVEEAL